MNSGGGAPVALPGGHPGGLGIGLGLVAGFVYGAGSALGLTPLLAATAAVAVQGIGFVIGEKAFHKGDIDGQRNGHGVHQKIRKRNLSQSPVGEQLTILSAFTLLCRVSILMSLLPRSGEQHA